MKENRKLLREVLNDIRHDMTDEGWRTAKFQLSPKAERKSIH